MRTLQSVGSVSESAIRDAELALITAKTELARHTASHSDGQRLAELRRRLEDTTIEQAECEAKLGSLSAIIEKTGNPGDLDPQRVEIELLEREYRQALEAWRRAERQTSAKGNRYQLPTVRILAMTRIDPKNQMKMIGGAGLR